MSRLSGRRPEQLRQVKITRDFTCHAEGSVLVEFGNTKVICTASVESGVPRFLRGKGEGWVTAEYGMLPRSTNSRMGREAARGKQSGRTQEIQRLIGRSLRAAVDLKQLGEHTINIDCDVIQTQAPVMDAVRVPVSHSLTQFVICNVRKPLVEIHWSAWWRRYRWVSIRVCQC